MPVPIEQLPDGAAAACRRARDELIEILGQDLVALWLAGGTTFPDRPLKPGDLDLAGVVAHVDPEERRYSLWKDEPSSRPHRVYTALAAIGCDSGRSVDAMFFLREDMGASEPPGEAFKVRGVHATWPIHRASWNAGQYVSLHGPEPADMVTVPTRQELETALDRELEHLERHVYEGDASDPYEATYAMWNGSRILYTLRTGSPVVSKRSAGRWGLENLDGRWHPALRAADRSYDGRADSEDEKLLEATMPDFVAMVRAELPPTAPPPPGPPRWS